jgi:hypothetical protein
MSNGCCQPHQNLLAFILLSKNVKMKKRIISPVALSACENVSLVQRVGVGGGGN